MPPGSAGLTVLSGQGTRIDLLRSRVCDNMGWILTIARPEPRSMPTPSGPFGSQERIPQDINDLLRIMVEGVAVETGERFFEALIKNLIAALGARHGFLAEFAETRQRVRTLALWSNGGIRERIEFDLKGTPCQAVLEGRPAHYPERLQQYFPENMGMVEWQAESYMGVPLIDRDGEVVGHLAVIDDKPMPPNANVTWIMQIFAARALAEIERARAVQALRASADQFRDLFEEAPIPYVYEDTETRFLSANRAFMQLLGLQPEDIPGTLGLSLVAKTRESQERIAASLAAEKAAQDNGIIELELRRKDTGAPVWVQRWSRPEPDGKHTRTMLMDITSRVLAEQESARLQQQNLYLQEEIRSEHHFDEIVGQNQGLQATLHKIDLVATTDATVLILGETGVGKELLARAIHSASRRSSQPLIKVNCAVLPAGLVESELFGHEKGAFTGAAARRSGRFELADGGTIFLDEVGDLPLEAQVKLLRVLQEQEFERVGGTQTLKVNVRVIAATNRDLLMAVADGTFRQDLFYRLNVFPLHAPPLRERLDDIPLLVRYFTQRFATRIGRKITIIPDVSMQRLLSYHWPGNVRELENIIERAVILSPGPSLDIGDEVLPAALAALKPIPTSAPPAIALPFGAPLGDHLDQVERERILDVLRGTKWVVEGPRGAAQILQMHPNTLRSRIRKLGIER